MFGWQDFDPTNNVMPRGDHFTVAWGRDYSDVSPVKGVALGGGEQVISVSVDVSPEASAQGADYRRFLRSLGIDHSSWRGKLEVNGNGYEMPLGASNQRALAKGAAPITSSQTNEHPHPVSVRQDRPEKKAQASGSGRAYFCRCGRPVFFRNSVCLACRTPLGYEPHLRQVYPLVQGPEPELWQLATEGAGHGKYRRCANLDSPAGCNWLVAEAETDGNPALFCIACRLNVLSPIFPCPRTACCGAAWKSAKRRVVSSLLALDLPVKSRVDQDTERGLAFDFLLFAARGPARVDGARRRDHHRQHRRSRRLRARARSRANARAVSHAAWPSAARSGALLLGPADCRIRLAGGFPQSCSATSAQDYAAALQRNYQQGPLPGWEQQHVSAYASTHPWEDWAETWAHYLHMVDTLDTALGFGLDTRDSKWKLTRSAVTRCSGPTIPAPSAFYRS